jgi:hypothetical protein
MTATQNLGILLIAKLRICDWKSVNAKSNHKKNIFVDAQNKVRPMYFTF